MFCVDGNLECVSGRWNDVVLYCCGAKFKNIATHERPYILYTHTLYLAAWVQTVYTPCDIRTRIQYSCAGAFAFRAKVKAHELGVYMTNTNTNTNCCFTMFSMRLSKCLFVYVRFGQCVSGLIVVLIRCSHGWIVSGKRNNILRLCGLFVFTETVSVESSFSLHDQNQGWLRIRCAHTSFECECSPSLLPDYVQCFLRHVCAIRANSA